MSAVSFCLNLSSLANNLTFLCLIPVFSNKRISHCTGFLNRFLMLGCILVGLSFLKFWVWCLVLQICGYTVKNYKFQYFVLLLGEVTGKVKKG